MYGQLLRNEGAASFPRLVVRNQGIDENDTKPENETEPLGVRLLFMIPIQWKIFRLIILFEILPFGFQPFFCLAAMLRRNPKRRK